MRRLTLKTAPWSGRQPGLHLAQPLAPLSDLISPLSRLLPGRRFQRLRFWQQQSRQRPARRSMHRAGVVVKPEIWVSLRARIWLVVSPATAPEPNLARSSASSFAIWAVVKPAACRPVRISACVVPMPNLGGPDGGDLTGRKFGELGGGQRCNLVRSEFCNLSRCQAADRRSATIYAGFTTPARTIAVLRGQLVGRQCAGLHRGHRRKHRT